MPSVMFGQPVVQVYVLFSLKYGGGQKWMHVILSVYANEAGFWVHPGLHFLSYGSANYEFVQLSLQNRL